MNKWRKLMSEDKVDVEAIDTYKLVSNLKHILSKLDLSFRSVNARVQKTFSNKEVIVDFVSPSVVTVNGRDKLSKFTVIVQSNGNIVVNASNKETKFLVPNEKVGNITTVSKLYDQRGLVQKTMKFAMDSVKSHLEA